jgi:hypothetical protein
MNFQKPFTKKLISTLLPFSILTTFGCSILPEKADDKKKAKKKTEKVVSTDTLHFEYPAKGDSSIITSDQIPSGDYQIISILTAFESTGDDKYLSYFEHSVKKAGSPAEGDMVRRATDFSKVDLEAATYYPAVSINLPLGIIADQTGTEFLNHY